MQTATRTELASELDDIATTMRLRELPTRRAMGYRPRYQLTLEAPPDRIPPVVRLRSTLKGLLRRHGLKCVSIEPVPRRVDYVMRQKRS